MEAAEELLRASIFQSSREAELEATGHFYRRAGYALACFNDSIRGLQKPWSGTERGLGDSLACG